MFSSFNKAKKDRLSKTSYFNDDVKLKEFYVKICKNLNCFGSILFKVKEIVYDMSNMNKSDGLLSFKKVKRLLVIKPNKISLVDYKTKLLIKSQRMSDLKSWFSGDGYYNLTPMFLLNNPKPNDLVDVSGVNHRENLNGSFSFGNHQLFSSNMHDNLLSRLFQFRFDSQSLDIEKLFVIEFRDCKWHLQIDDFQSLKSITCILLDQSLDMGIDNNPLMLDLTISEQYQNKYNIFSPGFSSCNRSQVTFF